MAMKRNKKGQFVKRGSGGGSRKRTGGGRSSSKRKRSGGGGGGGGTTRKRRRRSSSSALSLGGGGLLGAAKSVLPQAAAGGIAFLACRYATHYLLGEDENGESRDHGAMGYGAQAAIGLGLFLLARKVAPRYAMAVAIGAIGSLVVRGASDYLENPEELGLLSTEPDKAQLTGGGADAGAGISGVHRNLSGVRRRAA
jgi:hypothetical protein